MENPAKIFLKCLLNATLGFSVIFGFLKILHNSQSLTQQALILDQAIQSLPKSSEEHWLKLVAEAKARVDVYENQLQEDNLLDGMVVYSQADGGVNHVCDSLLFSSLRFVALKKLGLTQEANNAWKAIRQSKLGSYWIRHPQCSHTPTSRDMVIGLSAAISQTPEDYEKELFSLMNHIRMKKGFVSDSAPYVGYATPSLQEALRRMSHSQFDRDDENNALMPFGGNLSFSTLELDVLMLPDGFPTHLLALLTWIELEQNAKHKELGSYRGTRSITWEIGKWLDPLTFEKVHQQRMQWITSKLISYNSSNLFFQYLYLRSHNALNKNTKQLLLQRLLSMEQFPKDRLPMNCDRKADYLWQRSKAEYTKRSNQNPRSCTVQFPAVDFLWMASLLLEGETPFNETEAMLLPKKYD